MGSLLINRAEQLNSLQGGEQYDILVIGGGVTGTGVALDAVTRGEHLILCVCMSVCA